MGNHSTHGGSRAGAAWRGAIGLGVAFLASCSSSPPYGRWRPLDGGQATCQPGDTRKCVGPGACSGGQQCTRTSEWSDCDCGTSVVQTDSGSTAGGQSGVSGAGGRGAGGGAAGGVAGAFGGSGTGGNQPDAGCSAIDFRRETLPVDMYVMFDQSQSMSTQVPGSNPPVTWWMSAQAALASFIQDPLASGTGVGLQFFPYRGYTAGADPTVPTSSCYVPSYATPEVEIGFLPANAGSLVAAIQSHAPTTFTPTAAALQGAIDHMKQWGPAHPGRQPVVVLVTDGFPTECDPQDPSLIALIAKQAYDEPPRVLTFVIGFESGEALDNLGQIAKAGGTGEPFLISGGDIGRQFVQAMLRVTTSATPCEFDIPSGSPGSPVDPNQIWVRYVSGATGIPVVVPQVTNVGACSTTDGWYFDAPVNPAKIIVCPETCNAFGGGAVSVVYGCRPATP